MITNLVDFEQFFQRMGVIYTKSKHGSYTIGEGSKRIRYRSGWRLIVSQAIFHFSVNGDYLGVESDEMGYFQEREPQ